MYGCQNAQSPLLPLFLLRHLPFVSLKDCLFNVTPSKAGTARAVVNQEFGIAKSYTLEVSLSGYVEPSGEARHFVLEGEGVRGRGVRQVGQEGFWQAARTLGLLLKLARRRGGG